MRKDAVKNKDADSGSGRAAFVQAKYMFGKSRHGAFIHILINPLISLLMIIGGLAYGDFTALKHSQDDVDRLLLSTVQEQASLLSVIWQGQFETLNFAALSLSGYDSIDDDSIFLHLAKLEENGSFLQILCVSTNGDARVSNGQIININDSLYFQKALRGEWAVSRVNDSRIGTGERYILAVPMIKEDTIIGVVAGSYSNDVLIKTISPKNFDSTSYFLICRDDGTIIFHPEDPNHSVEGQDYFDIISQFQLDDGKTVEKVVNDISEGKNGTFSYEFYGEKLYAVYYPLDQYAASGERLVMFSIVPYKLINEMSEPQSRNNFIVLIIILLAAGLTTVALIISARRITNYLIKERETNRAINEQNRIAIEESGLTLARYDLAGGDFHCYSALTLGLGYAETLTNVPNVFIENGDVDTDSEPAFREFFENTRRGNACRELVLLRSDDGSFHWYDVSSKIVRDDKDKPSQAIILIKDINEQREKELAYTRWKQELADRDVNSYTMFRCNLSKGSSYDETSGNLLNGSFNPSLTTFNQRTHEYASRFVHLDDYEAYMALFNSEYLLAAYYRGNRTHSLNYRERVREGEYRWLHASIEMVQYPDSTEICIYMLYEKTDSEKAAQLSIKDLIDADSLTGALNRRAFIEQFSNLLSREQPTAKHALILVDIDNFRRLNGSFGHAVGDQALVGITDSLRSLLRESDILGRLGGDEFLICLKNIPNEIIVRQKAIQIQAAIRKPFGVDVHISASLGIAIYPNDGSNFNALYHCVDLALHTAKENGPDSMAFYHGETQITSYVADKTEKNLVRPSAPKRTILVFDDNQKTLEQLRSILAGEYHIECCADEDELRRKLNLVGILPDVLLLSIDMETVNSFDVLDWTRKLDGGRVVPVIAMSRMDEREWSSQVLEHGANDFFLVPAKPEVVLMRVRNAIINEENARLRTQNAFLQTQNYEGAEVRSLYEKSGTVVAEYDRDSHGFTYDPAFSEYILGTYDERPLWQVLMADLVADTQDIKKLQQLVFNLADDRECKNCSIDLLLKTPSKEKHWFTINAFKRVNDLNQTSKIIMTFRDVNDDILASKKLLFQAEHDILTGLYNRVTFLKLVEEKVRTRAGGSYLLLCCDINDFRFLNERFGREEGDKLLQYSAEKLMVYVDSSNGIAGRLSSDIFAALIPNSKGILKRIDDIIRNFFNDYPLKTRVTGRAGAYIITDPLMKADSMLDRAITAADSINGKYDEWLAHYDESMDKKRLQEKSIITRMESALAESQFDIYMQPQYNHASGKISGAEALVRWIDPQEGVISPGVFIPIFEKNGFITRLDEYVWEKTARYASEWMASGNLMVPISVNVSREDTNDPQLCGKLLKIVNKYNIPTHLFRLEITESLFSEDTQRLVSLVEQLHQAGFLVEMDDFGSGYSSLNILKDVPVDILKLDMRFFSGEDNLGRGGMIINAILRMARWLNIPVIAEGVELKEQADFLLSIGCPTIQGFLYSRPLPRNEFEKVLTENLSVLNHHQDSIVTDLDERQFWNPHSIDSQVFNHLMGPAAIFEYHNGEFEIIRMNRRFTTIMHNDETSMMPTKGLMHFSEEDQPRFRKAVLEAIYYGKDTKIDANCLLDDGSTGLFHIILRVIARSSDRALLLGEVLE